MAMPRLCDGNDGLFPGAAFEFAAHLLGGLADAHSGTLRRLRLGFGHGNFLSFGAATTATGGLHGNAPSSHMQKTTLFAVFVNNS